MDSSTHAIVIALQELELKLRYFAIQRGHSDPEQFYQDVWSRCVEYATKQSLLDEVAPLVWRIARGKLAEFHRCRRRVPAVVQLQIDPERLPHLETAGDEATELSTALSELPSRDRDAFCLKHVHDWKNGEIATELGLTKNGVRTAVYRTRQRLAKRLGQQYTLQHS